MKIVISFVGGSLDNCIFAGDSEKRTPSCEDALTYYRDSENGKVGRRFMVPHHDRDTYEVDRRLENGNYVIVYVKFVVR